MSPNNHSTHSGNCNEAIIFMDLQPRLLSSIPDSNSLLTTTSILAHAADMLALPSIITEQAPQKLGHTSNFVTEHLKTRHIIEKDTFSAFETKRFCELLESERIEKLTIAGIETPICVYLTAIDAISRQLKVTIISDAVGSRRFSDGDKCLQQLQHYGAEIIPLETFLFSKLKTSYHMCFKQISNLIKSRS